MASLYISSHSKPLSLYKDRKSSHDASTREAILAKSTTLYVGNLSFYTTEEQIFELFSTAGEIRRIIMGLDRIKKTPCGFCFVDYFTRRDAETAVRHLHSLKLDERFIKVDYDAGFEDGRQFGRGRSGGQVRDDYRTDYDPGRGGHGSLSAMQMWGGECDDAPPGGPGGGSHFVGRGERVGWRGAPMRGGGAPMRGGMHGPLGMNPNGPPQGMGMSGPPVTDFHDFRGGRGGRGAFRGGRGDFRGAHGGFRGSRGDFRGGHGDFRGGRGGRGGFRGDYQGGDRRLSFPAVSGRGMKRRRESLDAPIPGAPIIVGAGMTLGNNEALGGGDSSRGFVVDRKGEPRQAGDGDGEGGERPAKVRRGGGEEGGRGGGSEQEGQED